MATSAGEEPHGKPAAAVSPAEAAQGWVLPARARHGTDRVRRPADLLLAVFSLLIVAVVLGFIRALPLGSTEVAGDVSGWLLHIPRWLSFAAAVVAGVACFVLVIVALVVLARSQWRDARNAVAAGLAGAAAAVIASGVWQAGHGAMEHSVLHGNNPSMFVVDTAFVAFVVGTDRLRAGGPGCRRGRPAATRPGAVGVAGHARRPGFAEPDQARASRRRRRGANGPAGTIPLAYRCRHGRPDLRRLSAHRRDLRREHPRHAEPGQSRLARRRGARIGGDLPGGRREPCGVRTQASVHLARLPRPAVHRVRGRGHAADRGPRGRQRSLPAPRAGGRGHHCRRRHHVADRECGHYGAPADRVRPAHRVGIQPVQDRAGQ